MLAIGVGLSTGLPPHPGLLPPEGEKESEAPAAYERAGRSGSLCPIGGRGNFARVFAADHCWWLSAIAIIVRWYHAFLPNIRSSESEV